MKKHHFDIDLFAGYVWIVFMAIVFIGAIVFAIFKMWVFFKYGNTTVTELPAWVWWLMQSSGTNT